MRGLKYGEKKRYIDNDIELEIVYVNKQRLVL